MKLINQASIVVLALALFCSACEKPQDNEKPQGSMFDVEKMSSAEIDREAAKMGENRLEIYKSEAPIPDVGRQPDSVTAEDAKEILKTCPAVQAVSWGVNVSANLEYQGKSWSHLLAVDPAFLSVHDLKIAQGDSISDADVDAANKVCVIGSETATMLFGQKNPVGKEVSVVWIEPKTRPPSKYRIVGVLARESPIFGKANKKNSLALIPWTAAKQEDKAGGEGLWGWGITAKIVSREKVPEVIEQITELLRNRHHIMPGMEDDFVIEDGNQEITEYLEPHLSILKEKEKKGK